MKEIKFLLLCLVVALYTSIGLITFLTDWLKTSSVPMAGHGLFVICTLVILLVIGAYIHEHWADQELFNKKGK